MYFEFIQTLWYLRQAVLGLAISPIKSASAAGSAWDCNNYYNQSVPALASGSLVTINCNNELFVPATIDIKQDTIICGGTLHADPGYQLFHIISR